MSRMNEEEKTILTYPKNSAGSRVVSPYHDAPVYQITPCCVSCLRHRAYVSVCTPRVRSFQHRGLLGQKYLSSRGQSYRHPFEKRLQNKPEISNFVMYLLPTGRIFRLTILEDSIFIGKCTFIVAKESSMALQKVAVI